MAQKSKVLLSILLVAMLLTQQTQALCVIGVLQLNLLCPLGLCSVDNLLSNLLGGGSCTDSLIQIAPLTGTIKLSVDTNIVGLQINTNALSSVEVTLGSITISGDVILNGPGSVNIAAGAAATIGGILRIGTNGKLKVGGSIALGGGAAISGSIVLDGITSTGSLQTAWITSPSRVNISGQTGGVAKITGSGGIDATVQFDGISSTGQIGVESNIFISKNFIINPDAILHLGGNVTVQGSSNIFGNIHMSGSRISSKNQNAWLNPSSAVYLEGTPTSKAQMTGNGGIDGDVILGDYAGLAAGNSPGCLYYNGNIQMGYNSFMEIEVQGPGSADFDQYIIQKNLFRDGYLYVTFLNNYFPGVNNRFVFGAHTGSTGVFHTVITDIGNDVQSALSNRSSAFVYSDPVAPAYCTCTSVN